MRRSDLAAGHDRNRTLPLPRRARIQRKLAARRTGRKTRSVDLGSDPPSRAAGECAYDDGPQRSQEPPHPHARIPRSEEHTSELQSRQYLVCRLLLEKKKKRERKRGRKKKEKKKRKR